jgi:hypothetical protein
MIAGFSFVHDDRTYTCVAEAGPGGASEPWWWFTVNRDGNRYAPFRATTKDTRSSVQGKIVAYYANHLAHRAMPESQHWARRPKGVAAGGAPGTPGAIVLPSAVVAARALMAAKAATAAAAAAAEAAAKPAVKAAAVASKPTAKAAPAKPAGKAPSRPAAKIPARPAAKLRLVAKARPAPKHRASAKGR